MGTSRFVTTNYAVASTTSLKNGTGGAPARDEAAPYVMERFLHRDRFAFWRTSAAPTSPLSYDLDLGSAKTITGVGLHGFRAALPAAATTVNVQSATSYPPGAWTQRAALTLTAGPRDVGAVIAAVSARYWRFEIQNTSQFQIGKPLLGPVIDLGAAHAPGADASPHRFRNEQPFLGGGTLIEDLGDMGRTMSIPLPQATEARRVILEALADLPGTFAYFDPADGFFEAFVPNAGRIEIQRVLAAGASSLSSINVTLVREP